jgi:hypothetical protein
VPRKSGRLGDMAGSVMEYVIANVNTIFNLMKGASRFYIQLRYAKIACPERVQTSVYCDGMIELYRTTVIVLRRIDANVSLCRFKRKHQLPLLTIYPLTIPERWTIPVL